jgi:hypothetical protein
MSMFETTARIETGNGCAAALRPRPSGGLIEVRDAAGRLVFEYDSVTGHGTLHLPGTDLRLALAGGAVELSTASNLRLRSEGAVEIAGRRVRLAADGNKLELAPERVELRANALRAQVHRTSFQGRRIRVRAQDLYLTLGRVQRVLGRVVEWATAIYPRVEGLWHTRADRVRTEAERGILLQGETADVVARGDVRVQGDSINLG